MPVIVIACKCPRPLAYPASLIVIENARESTEFDKMGVVGSETLTQSLPWSANGTMRAHEDPCVVPRIASQSSQAGEGSARTGVDATYEWYLQERTKPALRVKMMYMEEVSMMNSIGHVCDGDGGERVNEGMGGHGRKDEYRKGQLHSETRRAPYIEV